LEHADIDEAAHPAVAAERVRVVVEVPKAAKLLPPRKSTRSIFS
jgi:hypothetical protein